MSGSYRTIMGKVEGNRVIFGKFTVGCGPGYGCSVVVVGFDSWFSFNNAWEFSATEYGDGEHGLVTVTVTGSMDTEEKRISGKWTVQAANCCSNNGGWYATKRGS